MSEQAIGLPDYLQKECEYLRTRLSTNIDETATLERLAITATGGLWAWIGTHKATVVPALFWLPLLLTLFLGFRAIAVYLRIKSIRTYLAKLEAVANVPPGLGWIACLEGSGGRYRVFTANVFWVGLNLLNLSVALLARAILAALQGSN